MVLAAVHQGALWEGDSLLVAFPVLGVGEAGQCEREAIEEVGSLDCRWVEEGSLE